MSDSHHDPIEDNIDTPPVKLAIGIVIGAIALITGIIMVVQFAIGSYGSRSLKDDPSMSAEAVGKRIAPVAQVAVDPTPPAPPPVAPAAPAGASAAAMPAAAIPSAAIPAAPGKTADAGAAGKATYDAVCSVCHATGIAGAPRFGDKAAWAARAKTGKEALYASALKGKGAMPPRAAMRRSPTTR